MLELPRYGNWSGQNFSNGENYPGRVLSDGEMRTPGRDPYDNYVAKAHDLNEIFAAEDLRTALVDASPVFNDLQKDPAGGDHAVPLIFEQSGGIFDPSRFADPTFYLKKVRTSEQRAVAAAFYRYFDHVMRSNMQFAINYAFNGLSFMGNFWSILNVAGMQIQLGGASHFFMDEAVKVERRLSDLSRSYSILQSDIASLPQTLWDRMVFPEFGSGRSEYISDFTAKPFVQKASVEMLVSASRDALRTRAADVIRQKNQ